MGNIFKGSSHGIRGGQYRHHDQTTGEPSRNSDSLSDFEEDIDLALALSLSLAEEGKGKNVTENESHLDQDEEIAKALQEEDEQLDKASHGSVNADSPPQAPPDDDRRRCDGCNGEISENKYIKSDNLSYHKSCYEELYYPKCDVCKNFIPTNAAVRNEVECGGHRYWSQKYCPSHNHDGTPRCCSCERMESTDAPYLTLEDGRKLCLECWGSSIMDNADAEQLYLEIQEFYERWDMKLEQPIPLLLVKREALNEAMEGEKGHHHMPETRGLCLFEPQIVNAISRSPRIGSYDQIMDLFTEPYTLDRECEVTAILVLYGLPRLLTGSILAHEMMHAWLRLNGYPTLSPNVEEGICQVLAHEWLASEILAGSAKWSESEKKLGEFFLHQIESDPSAAYGDGFREGKEAVINNGLKGTLDHILRTGCFP
ncbi:Adaptor protein Enigma [Handroanthus impetiginosus]|uniref:Adaptor protein Enigma n=1 Tax=Handroanthus impetiginosus TaxID=429701 RepID=A0A2G9HQ08_9LAMI|nr:Adaptor protein Enigma [Handroanthus impetiginosus]